MVMHSSDLHPDMSNQINVKDEATLSYAMLESCTEYCIIGCDVDLNIIAWNEGARRLLHYEAKEVIGKKSLLSMHDPEDVKSGKVQQIVEIAKHAGVWTGDIKCATKEGALVSVLYTMTNRTNASGKNIGFTMVGHDQTELSNKLQALTESNEYTRSLIESNMDVLMTTDSLGIINDVNAQICEMTGFSREELIGSPFKIHFTDPKRAEDLIRKVLSEDRIINYELITKSRHAKLTPVSFNAATFRTEDGHLKGIFATARNITEQKRLETQSMTQSNALLEATNLLNDVLKSSISYNIIALDLEGNVLIWNEGARRNYGYTSEEMVGKKAMSILHASQEVETDSASFMLEQALKIGTYDGVFEQVRKNAERFPALVSVTIRKDAEGKPVGYVVISKDITVQKQQEQVLREQLSYNRSLFESSLDVVLATDSLGIITDVNKQMCVVTGYKIGELIDTQFKNYFTDPKRAEDCIRNVLAEEKIRNYELTIKAKDGKETVISCNATTYKGTDNKLKGVFAVARDITEQKRLEVESREQNSKLKEATGFLNNVLESSTAYSIIAEDLQGNILAWNEGARLNYGYTAEEMVGKQNTSILHAPEDITSGRLQSVLDSALQTGKEEGVLESVRKNGERFTASLALTLRKDSNGKPVGYLLISKDITDQKREEVLLSKNVELVEQNRLTQEANRLKSEFLANMSHELRSPLNGIIGFAELMHLGKVGPISVEHKEYLGDILTSSRHLLRLINDVLDLAKVESGKMEFHPENVDLNIVVNEVCDILRTLISKRKIQLHIDINPSVANIIIDPAKLKQILYNYISNALKFTNEGGYLYVRALPEGPDNFRLEVEDTGIGIKEDDIPKLFSEFQQLDASLDKKYQGTGLGLALTRRIAEAQGGEVGVNSIVDKGSNFFVILPRAPLKLEQKNQAIEHQNTLTKVEPIVSEDSVSEKKTTLNILVVEDTPEDNTLLKNTLLNAGFTAETVFSGTQAIKICQEKQFDAITLDLLMPDMNGWDVLKGIRSKGPNMETPVVVVTLVGSKAASFGFMIQNFLIKPLNAEDLIAALQQTGIEENQNKTILFVDDDPKMLILCKQYLENYGSTLFCETDPEKALEVASVQKPDVVVLDLLMPGIDGLEFLRRFRATKNGLKTPVIICTSQDIDEIDRSRLKASVAAVIQKGGGSMNNLIVEINRICLQNDKTKELLVETLQVHDDDTLVTNSAIVKQVPANDIHLVEKKSPRILVVDDNPQDNALVEQTLVNVGYTVDVAFSGAQAVKICQEKQFDVITLDLLLPDMNGWDVLRIFRSKGANLETPVIVVTVVASKAASFGFMIQNFLIKPIQSEDLVMALQQTGIFENQNRTVLLVDDDPMMLELCKQYLKDYGSIILTESNPEQALRVAAVKRPDVIVLDLLMPSMDGLEFLRRFRMTEIGRVTPVIICTSQDISDVDRNRIKASVTTVIQKGGGSMNELVSEIQRICPIQLQSKK